MSMKDYEQALVFAAKNGNEKCFEELYKLYYQKVYALARTTLKNDADAEDVLQLTFISAWQNIASLEDISAFNTWIQRITLNQCYALLRKSKPEVSIDDEEADSLGIDELESDLMLPEVYSQKEDLRIRLEKIIDSLSEVQRQTIQLYYFDELSVEEISEVMDCSVSTVKSRLFLARKAIKTEIEETERKTGQKFYSVAGIPVLAFAQWFRQQAEACVISPSEAGAVFSKVEDTLNLKVTVKVLKDAVQAETVSKTSLASGGRTAVSTARNIVIGTSKKAARSLAIRIAAGTIAAATVAGAGAYIINEANSKKAVVERENRYEEKHYDNERKDDVRMKPAEPEAESEAESEMEEKRLPEQEKEPELYEAYSSYLKILERDREAILGYDWQNRENPHNESGMDRYMSDESTPITFADIYGDTTPEMIYIKGDGEKFEGRYLDTSLNIVTYDGDSTKQLYCGYWDSMASMGLGYALFQMEDEQALYARCSTGDEWWEDVYYRFTDDGSGTLVKEQMLKYYEYPINYTSSGPEYEHTYMLGEKEISEEDYVHHEFTLINRIKRFLIRNRYYDPDLSDKINELETKEMTYDKAVEYLELYLNNI